MVNDWGRKKRFRLTRKGGKATVSCDLKSSQFLSTVANNPNGYKVAEGITVAWANDGKECVRIAIEVVYDLDKEEEDLIEDDDSDTAIPVVEGARKAIGSESF